MSGETRGKDASLIILIIPRIIPLRTPTTALLAVGFVRDCHVADIAQSGSIGPRFAEMGASSTTLV